MFVEDVFGDWWGAGVVLKGVTGGLVVVSKVVVGWLVCC